MLTFLFFNFRAVSPRFLSPGQRPVYYTHFLQTADCQKVGQVSMRLGMSGFIETRPTLANYARQVETSPTLMHNIRQYHRTFPSSKMRIVYRGNALGKRKQKIIKGCKPVIIIHTNRINSILLRTYSAWIRRGHIFPRASP